MIYKDKCLEQGLPEPKFSETQFSYCVRTIKMGVRLNTRVCRYIGIHNLHSIVSTMRRRSVNFTLEHKRAVCPYSNELRPELVDHIYMDFEQREDALTGSNETNDKSFTLGGVNNAVGGNKSHVELNSRV